MAGVSYRFGPFVVDRGSYRITRDGQVVALTPKLLDLLLYLLERPGELVTKDELLEALWPGANVTENALVQAVSELRQALGDSASAPQYIKTIARRGYRVIVDVGRTGGPARREDSGQSVTQPPTDLRTIMVQDFDNVASDVEYAWLSTGVAETVTGDLRALGRFRVVDRWRVAEATRRTSGSLEQVAGALGAHLAVVGSFQRSADRIRITARVVDTSGEALAVAKVDGRLADIFDLQDRIVSALAQDLGLWPSPRVAHRPSRDTSQLDAYRAFTEGWVRLESFDIRELPQAMADFERAVSLDHRYAAAWAGLANAEVASYETTRFDVEPDTALLDRAIPHARQAIALDEDLAEAHGALSLALGSAGRMTDALAAAERAVALEPLGWRHLFRLSRASWGDSRLRAGTRTLALYPEFALSYFHMAMVYVARRQLADAEVLLQRGAAVQDQQIARGERLPGRGLHWLLGMTRLAQGAASDALAQFDQELTLTDLHHLHGREFAVRSHLGRGLALLTGGQADQAATACRVALELSPRHPEAHLSLAAALAGLGSAKTAALELAKAEAAIAVWARARPFDTPILRAALLAAHERLDEAEAALEALIDDAPPGAGWSLPIDPLLGRLHGRPGFEAVLARLVAGG